MNKALEERLHIVPPCVVKSEWKSFLVKHPWYPRRLLMDHFGIRPYDVENWKRVHPEVRWALSDPTRNFRHSESIEDLRRALQRAWEFLFRDVLEIDFEKKGQASAELMRLKGISTSQWAFLGDVRLFRRLPQYEEWLQKGHTQIAYVVFTIFPGNEWTRSMRIHPSQFSQDSKVHTRRELVDLMENIYLTELAGLSQNPSTQDIADAKKIFYVRAGENSFMTSAKFRPFGLKYNMTPHGMKDITRALREKFAVDLGVTAATPNDSWSASEFRRRFPAGEAKKCHYCKRMPVDLHHLLDRKEYPELMYHSDNVVPLCTLVHSAITRNAISLASSHELELARRKWKKARENPKGTFDAAMKNLHRELYLSRRVPRRASAGMRRNAAKEVD